MTVPIDLESFVSNIKNADFPGNGLPENWKKLHAGLETLLSTEDGIAYLINQSDHFECVLPFFVKVIYSDDFEISKSLFKHFDTVLDIFRSKLPKIKKCESWKKFELEYLVKAIPKLSGRVSPLDGSWVQIWSFTANLVVCETALSTVPLNTLLSISESSFRRGKEHPELLDQSWKCWVALINAFARSPKILLPSKTLALLSKPLLACSSVSKLRISTWIHLIEMMGITGSKDTLSQLVSSLCKAMYNQGDKTICRHLPDECAEALVKLLSYEQVHQSCLSEIVSMFGASVNSRPPVGVIEKLSSALIKAVNDCEDDSTSYKLWKDILEQYKTCSESPILAQACSLVFTRVNFLRWVDSGIVDGKEINELMDISDFRGKVLLRSIVSLPITDEDDNNSNKRKTKKGSPETIWSNYCEAYVSWWSNQAPPTPKENDKHSSDASIFSRDGHDYLASQALILYPIQLNTWNPTTFKTWTMICETCHRYKLLLSMIKQIFDALDHQNFQVQKAIDILSVLCSLDNTSWKQATKTLELLVPKVYSMEVKNVMDLLNLLETAVPSNELSSIIGRVLKNVNEICIAYDQLNAHKIRTKVGKITRKMEQLTNSSEKDLHSKTQRTPFRTQSNFLQRLAKAEEKNKTKSSFLSTIFSDTDKNKVAIDVGETDNGVTELSSQGSPPENVSKFSDDVTAKKLIKPLDDSENVPILMPLMSPSVLKENRSSLKGDNNETEVIAAEKENLILQKATASPAASSPTSRMKITNARELKTVDASSPSMVKKAKPLAGQKSTPKKVTPSKVSYFDDDASDFIMVPPKPKTTPLTEHQMEMMTKRRTDIPALYQDLSQDTQISNNPPSDVVVQDMNNGVSPQEDIVQGTPSPAMQSSLSTPEWPKSDMKPSSAKQLDFNNLMASPTTPLGKGSIDHGSPTVAPTCEAVSLPTATESTLASKMIDDSCLEMPSPSLNRASATEIDVPTENGGLISSGVAKCKDMDVIGTEMVIEGQEDGNHDMIRKEKDDSSANTKRNEQPVESMSVTPKKEIEAAGGELKGKRKRKSEPAKFSPKLTRSKRSLRCNTPDAKSSKPSTEPSINGTSDQINSKQTLTKESKSEDEKFDDNKEDGKGVSTCVLDTPNSSQEREQEPDGGCVGPVESPSEVQPSSSLSAYGMQKSSEAVVEKALPEIPEKKGRKRKTEDSSTTDACKKPKVSEEDISSTKKATPVKKKKKPFRLSSGASNLENWLVKTERVLNSISETGNSEKIETSNSEEPVSSEPLKLLSSDNVATEDLNNSDEIVPSTQELDVGILLETSIPSCPTPAICEPDKVIEIVDEGDCKKPPSPDHIHPQLPSESKDNEKEVPNVVVGGIDRVSPDKNLDSPDKNEDPPSLLQRLAQESPNDEIDLIIMSPTRRQRRASSVMRGEGDSYLMRDKFPSDISEESNEDESSKRSSRSRLKSSIHSRKSLHPSGGRSARMLRLAASSTCNDEEESGLSTPIRRRENIVPVTYGENWPKGPTEDWVACTPISPYTSPFRSVLKKPLLPGEEEIGTPQRGPQDLLSSPLLSSAKRKRVVFLDPPVTKGLIYERDSPFGAIHLANVPQGSPYPTWKGEENTSVKPSISSVARLDGDDLQVLSELDKTPENPISTEIHQPTITVPSNELEYSEFKDKFKLGDFFIETFSQSTLNIRYLLTQCFESSNMEETVDEWKLGDYRQVCALQLSILNSVKNEKGETLSEVLKGVPFIPAADPAPPSVCVESQTVSPILIDAHVQSNFPVGHASCQTTTSTSSVETNTIRLSTADLSTQADLELPSRDDLLPILKRLGSRGALKYFSDSLMLLSSLQDDK